MMVGKSMHRAIVHVLGFALFASGTLGCFRCVAQAPPTLEGELNRYGVPLTVEGLQSALRDPRPDVRSLAADELAAMKDAGSVPLIVQTLGVEKDALVRFNMASALLGLHSTAGAKVLSDVCDDRSEPEGHRLEAASRLVDAGDFRCVSSIVDILEKTTDASVRASALLIVAHIKPLPAAFFARIHAALLASLQDQTTAVRQYATKCIAALGDKAAIPYLHTAIANESDASTRRFMQESFANLEKEP